MEAEDIVRALAADPPWTGAWFSYWECQCAFCYTDADAGVSLHAQDCMWRLAVEWVAEHSQLSDSEMSAAIRWVEGNGPDRPPRLRSQ